MNEIKWQIEDDVGIEKQIESLAIVQVHPGIEINLGIFESLEFEARRQLQEAITWEITTETELKEAVNRQHKADSNRKALTKRRTEVQREPQEIIKRLGNLVTPITEILEKAARIWGGKIDQYQAQKVKDAQELNAAMQKKRDELQAKLDEETTRKGLAPIQVPELVEIKADTTIRTGEGVTAYRRETITIEINEPDQVPRQFCSPDRRKIMDAIKAGAEAIPGVTIKREKKLQTRGIGHA